LFSFQTGKKLAGLLCSIQASNGKEVSKRLRPNERRLALLEVLCARRYDTIRNLAREFRVCERTIRYDIEELTLAYPLETVQGNGGGVKVADGYFIGRKYLKPSQQQLLQKLTALLTGEDLIIMQSIFTDFGMTIPNERKGAKP